MGWPQYTIIMLFSLGVGIALAEHGKPKTGTNNMIYTLIGNGILLWVLWMGGFFS